MDSTFKFTPSSIDKTNHVGDYTDTEFKYLKLRISDKGAKTFFVLKRHEKKNYRKTLGRYPGLQPVPARKMAQDFVSSIFSGEYQTKEEKIISEEIEKAKKTTLEEAVTLYLDKNIATQSKRQYDSIYRNHLEKIGHIPITKIDVPLIKNLFDQIETQSVKNMAIRLLTAVLNHAQLHYRPHGQSIILTNEAAIASKLYKIHRPLKPRTGRLYESQIEQFWDDTENLIIGHRVYLRTLLASGSRSGAWKKLKWSMFDFEEGIITIPKSLTKAKNRDSMSDLIVPLNKILLDEFSLLKKFTKDDRVFPKVNFQSCGDLIKGAGFSFHDLRRTFISFGSKLRIPDNLMRILTHHSTNGDVHLNYIVDDVEDLKEASEKIASYILMNTHKREDAKIIDFGGLQTKSG